MPADLRALGKDEDSFTAVAAIGDLPSSLGLDALLRRRLGFPPPDSSSVPAANSAQSHFVGEAACHPHFGEFLQGAIEVDKGGNTTISRLGLSTACGSHLMTFEDLDVFGALAKSKFGETVLSQH
jgi:hypothetical protein